jgi:transposase
MMILSTGIFCERLQSKAACYAVRHVFCDTGKPGTSKTASCCGWWNARLRVEDKMIACPKCQVQIDGQVNGARGNFLAAIGVATCTPWNGRSG